jgi:hypothetical protein
MLETYHYEMAILSTANHLLSTDTFKSMRAYVRRRCKGVRVSLPSDVSAASVEALEVMPSGNVVVQVEPFLPPPCSSPVIPHALSRAASHIGDAVSIPQLARHRSCCGRRRSVGPHCQAAARALQQVLQDGERARYFGVSCLLSCLLVRFDRGCCRQLRLL